MAEDDDDDRRASDDDWLERLAKVYPPAQRGSNEPIVQATGLTTQQVSKARAGTGSAPVVFRISRAAGIAPPRKLLDPTQFHLLDQLEQFRSEIVRRFGDAALGAIEKAFREQFDRTIGEMLNGRAGAEPPALPLGRSGTDR